MNKIKDKQIKSEDNSFGFDSHGGDIYTYISNTSKSPIDFSANVNPLGLPKGVKNVLKRSVKYFSAYPDVSCKKLRSAIANYENVDFDDVLCGNGAGDLIYKIAYAIKPKRALITAPTFSEYESALLNVGCEMNYHYLSPVNQFSLTDDILSDISNVDIVFICNPNNPTGQIVNKDLMKKIVEKCKMTNALLVVDECFMDFLEDKDHLTMKTVLESYHNLVILKAFTKIFAFAGLRLGYCLSKNHNILTQISKTSQPWCVSVPSQIGGVKALSDKRYLIKTRNIIKKERKYLFDNLVNLGFLVFESHANYILFCDKNIKKYKDKKPVDQNLHDCLYDEGFLIRKAKNYRGLDDSYYRIAVKSHKDNVKFIKSIKKVLEK